MKHSDLLIIDDETRYADMLARRLELRDCRCEVCYNGGDGIRIIEKKMFLLVVLDLQLPDMYGTEVLARIKKIRPDIPVIILTGHGSEKDRQQCMKQGAYAFIHKPLNIEKLLDILNEIREKSA